MHQCTDAAGGVAGCSSPIGMGAAVPGLAVEVLVPPVTNHINDLQVLKHQTAQSAQTLRDLLGQIRLEPTTPDVGRPFYRAITSLDALTLIETPSDQKKRGKQFEYFAKVET